MTREEHIFEASKKFSDCDEHCESEEYEDDQTITYIPKTKHIMM